MTVEVGNGGGGREWVEKVGGGGEGGGDVEKRKGKIVYKNKLWAILSSLRAMFNKPFFFFLSTPLLPKFCIGVDEKKMLQVKKNRGSNSSVS